MKGDWIPRDFYDVIFSDLGDPSPPKWKGLKMSHGPKNPTLLSIILVNRDPYFMAYDNPYITG